MPAEHDLDPDAMTEKERLAKRRYEAYFAFETAPCPTCGGTKVVAADEPIIRWVPCPDCVD